MLQISNESTMGLFLMIIFVSFAFVSATSPMCQGVIEVKSQQDIDAISGCSAFSGTIAISNTKLEHIVIPTIQTVSGTIDVHNNRHLKTLSLPHLRSSTNFIFNDNPSLQTIQAPSLTHADTITVRTAPALTRLSFPSGLSEIENLEVGDTMVGSLDGVTPKRINSLRLANNPALSRVEMSSIKSAGSLYFEGNGRKDFVFEAPYLTELGEASIKQAIYTSFPSLTTVVSSMTFDQNNFETLSLPKVSSIGGSLTLTSNDKLTSTDFPTLNHIGGSLRIDNNSLLKNLDGFKGLTKVDGDIEVKGSFDKPQFPVLEDASKINKPKPQQKKEEEPIRNDKEVPEKSEKSEKQSEQSQMSSQKEQPLKSFAQRISAFAPTFIFFVQVCLRIMTLL